jgi:hypothetical protein
VTRRVDAGRLASLLALLLLTVLALLPVKAAALPLLLLVPGATLRAALLRQPVLTFTAESVGLSFVLSLAALIGCALALGVIGLRLSAGSVVAAIDVLTFAAICGGRVPGGAISRSMLLRIAALLGVLAAAATGVILLSRALPGTAPDPFVEAYLVTQSVHMPGTQLGGVAQIEVEVDNGTARPQLFTLSASSPFTLSGTSAGVRVPAGRRATGGLELQLAPQACGHSVQVVVREALAELSTFFVPVECP